MITLQCLHNPKQLGDTIDALFLAHMISRIESTQVNIQINHPDQKLLNDFVGFGDVIVGLGNLGKVISFHNNTQEGMTLYHKYSSQFSDIPKIYIPHENKNFNLPKKPYITAQWDAQQIYRRPDKYDKELPNKIEQWYRDKYGYNIVRTGGEGIYKNLKDIIYVTSHAELHIGAGSGMLHIAKFVMPMNNIHYYHNIQKREDDKRFPDGWDVAWMGREILRRGARLNFWKLNEDKENYFKDVRLFHDKSI